MASGRMCHKNFVFVAHTNGILNLKVSYLLRLLGNKSPKPPATFSASVECLAKSRKIFWRFTAKIFLMRRSKAEKILSLTGACQSKIFSKTEPQNILYTRRKI